MKPSTAKKTILSAIFCLTLLLLPSCSWNLTNMDDIVKLYTQNQTAFSESALTGDFSAVEKIAGVQQVSIYDTYVDIRCGGRGLGSSTYYYGIFYSADDDLTAVDVAGPLEELVEDGSGYRYKQADGDNEYYVEPLGNHYFYYEAHF